MFVLAMLIAAATPPAGAKETPIDPDQKIRCVREEVTGSLAATHKVCRTVGEWRKQAEATQSSAQRAIEAGLICPSCQGK